jgi:hypothetical protein
MEPGNFGTSILRRWLTQKQGMPLPKRKVSVSVLLTHLLIGKEASAAPANLCIYFSSVSNEIHLSHILIIVSKAMQAIYTRLSFTTVVCSMALENVTKPHQQNFLNCSWKVLYGRQAVVVLALKYVSLNHSGPILTNCRLLTVVVGQRQMTGEI